MARNVIIFSKCIGLNNKVAPMRAEYSFKDGLGFLSEAVNVKIDETGGIYSRNGFEATSITLAVHSLWSEKDWCFFVSGDTLYRLFSDYSTSVIKTGLSTGLKMSYCVLGQYVFYTNGVQNGAINVDGSVDWVVVNELSRDGIRGFSSPPVGEKLVSFMGRVWIADGKVLWFSEPYDPFSYNLAENFFVLNSSILDMKCLDSGIYVMTKDGVFFLNGMSIKTLTMNQVFSGKPIPGTMQKFNASDHFSAKNTADGSDKSDKGSKIIWASGAGLIVGDNSGDISNMTMTTITLPEISQSVSASMYEDGDYIVTMEVV